MFRNMLKFLKDRRVAEAVREKTFEGSDRLIATLDRAKAAASKAKDNVKELECLLNKMTKETGKNVE